MSITNVGYIQFSQFAAISVRKKIIVYVSLFWRIWRKKQISLVLFYPWSNQVMYIYFNSRTNHQTGFYKEGRFNLGKYSWRLFQVSFCHKWNLTWLFSPEAVCAICLTSCQTTRVRILGNLKTSIKSMKSLELSPWTQDANWTYINMFRRRQKQLLKKLKITWESFILSKVVSH